MAAKIASQTSGGGLGWISLVFALLIFMMGYLPLTNECAFEIQATYHWSIINRLFFKVGSMPGDVKLNVCLHFFQ